MTKKPKPRSGVLDIAPYKPGDAGRGFKGKRIRLASNENALGASPKATAAYKKYQDLHRYPDDTCAALKKTVADFYKIKADKLIFGAGSSEVIRRLIHTYASDGDEVLFPEYGFLMYTIYAKSCGAKPVLAKEKNYTTDVDSLLGKVTKKTKVVVIASPNNPTGTETSLAELKRLHQGLRSDILLIIDHAYIEYLDDNVNPYFRWVEKHKNIVLTRTFSKIYGLAALRLGWAYADESVIDAVWRTHDPFNINAAVQAAAIAALSDKAFIQKTKTTTADVRKYFLKALDKLKLTYLPTRANFVLVHFGKAAAKINEDLIKRGVFVRPVGNYNLPEHLRITLGTKEEMKILLTHLKDILERK